MPEETTPDGSDSAPGPPFPQVGKLGIIQLLGLPNLRWLSLRDTPLMDGGLTTLSEVKELEKPDVRGTRTTDVGISALEKRRPDLVLRRSSE